MKYYFVNTNKKANPEGQDEIQMLQEKIVSLYFDGHKERINKLNAGDIVFLYSNEVGVIACGEVTGKTLTRNYKGLIRFKNEERYQKFQSFFVPQKPITVKEMTTMFGARPAVLKSFCSMPEKNGQILFDAVISKPSHLRIA